MTTETRPIALVTGASAGIGAELAARAAADGFDLVLTARRTAPLEALAERLRKRYGAESTIIAADLATARGPAGLLKEIAGRGLAIDVLVNNAGFGAAGRFDMMDAKTVDGMIAVNIAAVTRLARALLPGMLERPRGGVLNVASTAAFQPGPMMAVYYATKSYVLSFSEARWEETRGSGVTVTALCPGPTRTEFQARAKMEDMPLFRG
ncbi:MAG: SDR family NAD(P)-dependent oxidoreductase, partial [Inquilinus sp.]|nr:SDR family NAD(P)-dependent oxidoreductase [Inquilinus sp.]